MLTAVDSSVLLDVLLDDPLHARTSEAALRHAASEGSLVVCEIGLAEVAPVLGKDEIGPFLADWKLGFVPSSRESALAAGEMSRLYLERGGKRGRVVADFLVASHVQAHADRLLARDRGFYRDYFQNLELWNPSGTKLN